jgi:hypothetical protein
LVPLCEARFFIAFSNITAIILAGFPRLSIYPAFLLTKMPQSAYDCKKEVTLRMNETKELIFRIRAAYPAAQLTDYVRFIYESEFGGETAGAAEIEKSMRSAPLAPELCEPLGGGLSRINLGNARRAGLTAATLAKMSGLSAPEGSADRFHDKLNILRYMCESGELPFSSGVWNIYMLNYQAAGFPRLGHSAAFMEKYRPACVVVGEDYAKYVSVFCAADKMLSAGSGGAAAIDGFRASGKTYLSKLLSDCFGCRVFHTRDFFLPEHECTSWKNSMDAEQLAQAISMARADGGGFIAVEGLFSAQPRLRRLYGFTAALKMSPEHELYRLKKSLSMRDMKLCAERWLPMERKYFAETGLFDTADIVIE